MRFGVIGQCLERTVGAGAAEWEDAGLTASAARILVPRAAPLAVSQAVSASLDVLRSMQLDVLTGIQEIPVCVAYDVDGVRYQDLPLDQGAFAAAMPVFETFPGWDEDISRARSLSDLPANARDYVSAVEELSDCRISTIGVGPGRDEIIQINDLLHSR